MCLGKWVLGMIKEAKQLRLTKKGKQSARKMGRGGGGQGDIHRAHEQAQNF